MKRTAFRTEDHPIEYGDFEGIIPPKQYGAGTVLIWDQGTWQAIENAKAGLHRGRLRFVLHGKKLSGRWSLVRNWADKEREVWWLIKAEDEAARTGDDANIVELLPHSVISGRSIEQIARDADRVWHSGQGATTDVQAESAKAPAEVERRANPRRAQCGDTASAGARAREPRE